MSPRNTGLSEGQMPTGAFAAAKAVGGSFPSVGGAHPALSWKEAILQRNVIRLASTLGWRHYHTHRSDRSPAGFPDLVLVHADRGRILYRELKSQRGRVRPEQTEWLNDLVAAGQNAGIWRPQDWINRTIEQELRK